MAKQTLQDEGQPFEVTVLTPQRPSHVVLFAVGGGGSPERHAPLLSAFAERGGCVVAPHFDRFMSPFPSREQLVLRARRLMLALHTVRYVELPIVGVGHSIGATMLLALAGARAWMSASDQPLPISDRIAFKRLVLLAPATGFFQAPFALDDLHVPLLVFAGTHDTVTPVAQAEYLKHTLAGRVPVDLRICEGAGHFSFMNLPPPQTVEPLADREAFLARIRDEACEYLSS